MYLDLSLPDVKSPGDPRLAEALRLGYKAVANNVTVPGSLALPVAPKFTHSVPALRVLQRVTVVLDDSALQHQVVNQLPAHQTWDVVAVRPLTEKAFALACERAETDIISLNLDDRLPFKLRPQQLRIATARGVTFELCCSALLKGTVISDGNARRSAIGQARAITRIVAERGLILTSGATEPLLMRAPLEMCALAALFGLTHSAAVAAMSSVAESALQRGLARHTYRGAIAIRKAVPADVQSRAVTGEVVSEGDIPAPAHLAVDAESRSQTFDRDPMQS